MRPIEESYNRIAQHTGDANPSIGVSKLGDEWHVVSQRYDAHGLGGTVELAFHRLANFIEANAPRQHVPR